MDLGLRGKVVIVTGGGQGCGKAYCLAFANEGASVVVADLNEDTAKQTVREIANKGGKARSFKVDVSKWADVSKMVEKTLAEFGQVDILVNNAGSRWFAAVENITDEIFDKEIQVNLRGAVYCIKAVAPNMKARKYGKIINQSSMAAIRGHGNKGSLYAAAKGGMISFSRSMSQELGSFNINVNVVAPSMVETAFLDDMPAAAKAARAKSSIFGRLAQPEDMVGIVLLLASDRTSYITGQTIQVDGGQRPT